MSHIDQKWESRTSYKDQGS